ncbi:zf-TFIIB domain-containing protein [Paenibacillus sp. LHD-117]|uniref:TFIIB-type zinc ribbon-containing protein n=1 Tax=Paenibacillus sp. LHD-117 TaxID=3071412 RepID=UPI0035A9A351
MNCPVCDDVRMKEVQKDDVLIDVCPACKGVWLDRGELEKLLQGVREVRADYERMEQHIQDPAYGKPNQPSSPPGAAPNSQSPSGGFGGSPSQGQQGFGSSAPGQAQPGYGVPGQGYGGTPGTGYGQPQQGAYPPPPAGGPGYQQAPGSYGQPGYGQSSGHGHGHSPYGYDKYGRPYKKKKTVLDVFGDLFE